MLTNRSLILAKTESTYDTDASPTGSEAVLVENLEPNPAESARMVDNPATRPSLAARQQLFGGTLMSISFDVKLRGSGSAGTAPEWGPLMKACGMAETVQTSQVDYKPASSSHKSVTIYYQLDGIQYALTGARGTVSLSAEAGGYATLSFTFTGHVSDPTDTALVTPTFDGVQPPIFKDAAFSIGGYSAVIASLSMDAGVQVATPPDASAADGFDEIIITGREVTGEIDPKLTLVATNDWIGDWKAGKTMALDSGVVGTTAGNKWQLTQPAVYYREPSHDDRDGLATVGLSYGAVESAGDDEFTLTLT